LGYIFSTKRGDPFDVIIYTKREHPPAHVHVWDVGVGDVVVNLVPDVHFRHDPKYMDDEDKLKMLTFIEKHQDLLKQEWRRLTGLPFEE
jgi:hypothetical protein